MKASILDFRRRTKDILRALDRNEPVTVLYRGKKKGVLYPASALVTNARPVAEHPAFGLWKDRKDMKDVDASVQDLRKGRGHAL